MKSFFTILGVLIITSTIGAAFYYGYLAIGYLRHMYVGIDATQRLIILSAFTVFLFGCFLLAGAIKSSAKLKNKGRLVKERINLYKTIIGLYESVLFGSRAVTAQSQKAVQIKLGELNTEMILMTDGAVIKAHRKLEIALINGEDEDALHSLYQQLVRKMRQDLGYGPNIDETRLSFLKAGDRNKQADSRSYNISG